MDQLVENSIHSFFRSLVYHSPSQHAVLVSWNASTMGLEFACQCCKSSDIAGMVAKINQWWKLTILANSCSASTMTGCLESVMELTLLSQSMAPFCTTQCPKKSIVVQPNWTLAYVPEGVKTTGVDEACALLHLYCSSMNCLITHCSGFLMKCVYGMYTRYISLHYMAICI